MIKKVKYKYDLFSHVLINGQTGLNGQTVKAVSPIKRVSLAFALGPR
ncbi:hypothetical protein ABID12_003141 [Martelella mangrovi]|uniref:Uncharacterized protein n=1 Tax=Martelella mangrovi TaxID=1397477 RepID=A0ABV2IE36_9HYPH